jgi:hypothetical protein
MPVWPALRVTTASPVIFSGVWDQRRGTGAEHPVPHPTCENAGAGRGRGVFPIYKKGGLAVLLGFSALADGKNSGR